MLTRITSMLYLVIVVFLSSAIVAQEKAIPPSVTSPMLSELQRLQLLNASKDVELWEVRLQTVSLQLEKARAALQKMVGDMTPPGYRMTEKMELVKLPEQSALPPKEAK